MEKSTKVILIGVASLGAFYIGYKMYRKSATQTEMKNLKDGAKSETVKPSSPEAKTPTGSGWDRGYWKKVGGTVPNNASASAMAKQLNGWIGKVWADEEAIYSFFEKLPSRAYLSRIADNYEMLYKVSLEKDIQRIGSSDVKKVMGLAESLPLKS